MTIQMKPLLWPSALLALLSAPTLASAYYDPGVQRWINRDPLLEPGFEIVRSAYAPSGAPRGFLSFGEFLEGLSLYGFLRNTPTMHVDPFGTVTAWYCVCQVAPSPPSAPCRSLGDIINWPLHVGCSIACVCISGDLPPSVTFSVHTIPDGIACWVALSLLGRPSGIISPHPL